MSSDDDLRQQMAELSARVAALEAELRARREVPAASPAKAVAIPPPGSLSSAAETRKAADSSLERRIGAQLLNRIGILVVLVGVAWFLKLAFDYNWIGPPVRVLIGLVCAAGLMVWSERFRRHGFAAFSYSLKALATSIAYLSLWAAFSLYHLAPSPVVFLAMTAVTISNAVLARRQDSEVLALYALAGGLATPALLWTGHSDHFFLFLYLILLNAGGLLLLALRPWERLAWAALAGTALYYLALCEYQAASLPWTVFFLALYFAIFASAPFLIARRSDSQPNALFPIAFPIANGLATFLAFLWLFGSPGQQLGRFWATAILGSACLLMSRGGPLVFSHTKVLSRTNLGLGIFLLTVAVPLEFDRPVVILCWLGEALALFVLARAHGHRVMRVFAAAVLIAAAFSLLVDWVAGTRQPLAVVANLRLVTNLVAAAVFAAVSRLSVDDAENRYLSGFSSIAFSLSVLVAVSLEIHHYWFCGAGFFRDFCGGYGQLERRSIVAGWDNTAWYMLYGAALMAAGFLRRSAFLRWQALGLLAFTIAKVFLNGVSQQSEGYRVLSFLALGVLLLAVSFAYQKDWLRLRG
jgi:uncharacterized membrane protein